jgi:hypothetical protein
MEFRGLTGVMHQLMKNEDGLYTVISYKMALENGKIKKQLINEEIRIAPDEVFLVLSSFGVTYKDINVAVNEMEIHRHNSAGFGINGNFVSSFNDIVIH